MEAEEARFVTEVKSKKDTKLNFLSVAALWTENQTKVPVLFFYFVFHQWALLTVNAAE